MMDGVSPHRERGWILARQGWPELAEKEYRLALAEDPDDFVAHAMLALLLSERDGRGEEALREARTAVGLAPDEPFAHSAEAQVHLAAKRWDAAEQSVGEAIRIDPDDPFLFVVLAECHLGRRRWQDALDAADQGLAIDPAYVPCLNVRATALVHLDRRDEASATLVGALGRDPENSHTHANQGWASLHRGDRRAGLAHFREALRLDPQSEWARQGLAEAMKARNPVYAAMLTYFLWMQRLSPRARWGVVLGGMLGFRLVRTAARVNPELMPWLLPLMVAYGVFLMLSWTAPQLFNALLLLSRDGRDVLSDEQRTSGRWVGGGALLALGMGLLALGFPAGWSFSGALLATLLLIPLAATFNGPRGRPTRTMAFFTGGVYLLGALAVAGEWASVAIGSALVGICLLLVVGSTWVISTRRE
jgi:tetratricopeptide (TPR) repeat protein